MGGRVIGVGVGISKADGGGVGDGGVENDGGAFACEVLVVSGGVGFTGVGGNGVVVDGAGPRGGGGLGNDCGDEGSWFAWDAGRTFLCLRSYHPTPSPLGSAADDPGCGCSSVSIARRSVNAAHINPSGSLFARQCRPWLVNVFASKRLSSTAFIILAGVESARIEAAAPRLIVAGSKTSSSPVGILTKSERSTSCASSNVPSSAG